MNELLKLPNVGKVLEENLLAVGIKTPQQLREIGAKEASLRIRMQRDPGACLHMLYGIHGAVYGISEKLLTSEMKQELKAFFNSLN